MAIKIFIDQGHNPTSHNIGATGFGLAEDEVTYNVGVRLAQLLNANPDFEARLSRNSPDEVLGTSNASSLARRVQLAEEWGADYFISLHTNAVDNPQANGTEVLVYRLGSPVSVLAQDILQQIVNRMGTRNRGVKANPTLYVLRETSMPALLIELAFITNYSDAQKLGNDPNGFATAIYRGITEYFG